MLAGILRQRAGCPQFIAQFVGAIKMNRIRLTRVVENDYAVGFVVPGTGDLNIANTMGAQPNRKRLPMSQ
jgi:hypothetical protein